MDQGATSRPESSDVEIEIEFEHFLRSKSSSSSHDLEQQRDVLDEWTSAFLDQIPKHPRRQVLLLSEDGKIVLGYHNQNNDEVYSLSSRGKDGGTDLYHESWSLKDIVVGNIPGCIEYLEALLTKNGTCGHVPLVTRDSNIYSGIPARLCFFSQWSDPDRGMNDDIFYIDTSNLCQNCYHLAVPRGFNLWSTSYFDRYNQKIDRDYKSYFRKYYIDWGVLGLASHDAESGSFLRRYWPRCYSAKTRILAFNDAQYPRMPGPTVAHECWRWLVWNRAPFYIDQLCIYPPYTVYEDQEQKRVENQRISQLNASAYIGAAHGILGIPPGDRGPWTMVELRILGERAVRLPDEFGDPGALARLGPGYIVHGDTYWEPPPAKWSGRLKKVPDYSHTAMKQAIEDQKMAPSERLPEESEVLEELEIQFEKRLGPTPEELERIRQFPDRDYSETVRKYEELLSILKDRLSQKRPPVDTTPHPTIEQANISAQQSTKRLKESPEDLIDLADHSHFSATPNPSKPSRGKPVFYRFAGKEPKPWEPWDRSLGIVNFGSRRLDQLYCHDASPYVFRGPFQIMEDEIEIEKWILGVRIGAYEQQVREVKRKLRSTKARLGELEGTELRPLQTKRRLTL